MPGFLHTPRAARRGAGASFLRPRASRALRMVWIPAGALVAALGLQLFLLPNQLVDGGVVGLAMLVGHLTGWPVEVFTLGLNLPFLYLAYRRAGKQFAMATLAAICLFSAALAGVRGLPGITSDLLLASVFGGLFLGIGVGIIIRYGGSLDGAEIIAVIVSRRTGFSVGEIVLVLNALVFALAGWVIGWERALYSLLTTLAGYRAIDVAVQGLEASRSVLVVSDVAGRLAEAITLQFGHGVTRLSGEGAYSRASKGVLFCVVSRLEVAQLNRLVLGIDPGAFIAVHSVREVHHGAKDAWPEGGRT